MNLFRSISVRVFGQILNLGFLALIYAHRPTPEIGQFFFFFYSANFIGFIMRGTLDISSVRTLSQNTDYHYRLLKVIIIEDIKVAIRYIFAVAAIFILACSVLNLIYSESYSYSILDFTNVYSLSLVMAVAIYFTELLRGLGYRTLYFFALFCVVPIIQIVGVLIFPELTLLLLTFLAYAALGISTICLVFYHHNQLDKEYKQSIHYEKRIEPARDSRSLWATAFLNRAVAPFIPAATTFILGNPELTAMVVFVQRFINACSMPIASAGAYFLPIFVNNIRIRKLNYVEDISRKIGNWSLVYITVCFLIYMSFTDVLRSLVGEIPQIHMIFYFAAIMISAKSGLAGTIVLAAYKSEHALMALLAHSIIYFFGATILLYFGLENLFFLSFVLANFTRYLIIMRASKNILKITE